MQELMKSPGVDRINADQCQFGAEVQSGQFKGEPVVKPTGFLSNGSRILQALNRAKGNTFSVLARSPKTLRDTLQVSSKLS